MAGWMDGRGTVTKLRSAQFSVQIASKNRDLSLLRNVQTVSGGTQSPIQWISREKSGWGVQMTRPPTSAVAKNLWRCTVHILHYMPAFSAHCYICYKVPYKYGINHFVHVQYRITSM
jgi:hypothetical protein